MERSLRGSLFPALLAVLSAFLGWRLWVHYQGLSFGYADFVRSNEVLTSFVREGRWFWLAEEGRSLWATHFTPSLGLWSLVLSFFPSNFTLLVLGLLSWVASGLLLERLMKLWPLQSHFYERALLVIVLLLQPVVLKLIIAPKMELFFLPLALATMDAFLRGRAVIWMGCLLLALGVRQDAGLFMAAFYLPFLFESQFRLRAAWGLSLSLLSLLLLSTLGLRAFGGEALVGLPSGLDDMGTLALLLPTLWICAWLLWSLLRLRSARLGHGGLALALAYVAIGNADRGLWASPQPMFDGSRGALASRVQEHLELCPNAQSVSGDDRLLGAVSNRYRRHRIADESQAEWRLRYENGLVWGSGRDGFVCEGGWFSQELGR